jgi:hypothetical protein
MEVPGQFHTPAVLLHVPSMWGGGELVGPSAGLNAVEKKSSPAYARDRTPIPRSSIPWEDFFPVDQC